MNYAALKALARTRRRPVPDLLALAPANDPFYVGAPYQVAAAEWFGSVAQRPDVPRLFHLRRVHYVLVSDGTVPKPDGTPYENTEESWTFLNNASRFARYLHLVDPRRFADHRSPDPILRFPDGPSDAVTPSVGLGAGWLLDALQIARPSDLPDPAGIYLPPPDVSGYEPDAFDQPYHVVIFIEKTTQNDILVPLADELALDLYPGAGFQSITAVINVLSEAAETGKPIRAFFISDFDPAGAGMPVATARQLEFWGPILAPGVDVALHHLALTRDQVDAFALPRIPIKETDRRRANFEGIHGEGAVELDALEAVHPGTLEEVVREAVAPYRDETLPRRLRTAEREAEDAVLDAWERHLAPREPEIQALSDELHRVSHALVSHLADIERELVETWAPPALPERPQAAAGGAAETDWLYHSGRDYLEQLAYYRQRREAA